MKYWLFAFLLVFASVQAEAQIFKKKKKREPTAIPAAQRPVADDDVPGDQELTIDDLLDIMDRREDSAHIRGLLIKAGFNKNAKAENNQIVFMGDTARGVTKYTEMVFLQTFNGEVQLVQFLTRHATKFEAIRRELRTSRRFTGMPTLTEEGEMSEAFYMRDYQVLIESTSKKTRFIVSVWLKGAKL